MSNNITLENISETIHLIRGERVMLDFNLASLYGVETRALKQQVKRNIERFPEDFMFSLSEEEIDGMVSQNVIPSRKVLGGALPMAFTEQGVAMLSSVLNSKRAIEINISIMRTFTQIRKIALNNESIARKLSELERASHLKFLQYDEQFRIIMDLMQRMNIEDTEENNRKIGFKTDI